MPQVICTLENASELINGVKFSPREDGAMVSEEISEDVAALFASIPGYELVKEAAQAPAPAPAPAAPARASRKGAAAPAPAPAPVAEPTEPATSETEPAAGDQPPVGDDEAVF